MLYFNNPLDATSIGFINIILLGWYVVSPKLSTVLPDKIQSPDIFIIIASSPDILTILLQYILLKYGNNINLSLSLL